MVHYKGQSPNARGENQPSRTWTNRAIEGRKQNKYPKKKERKETIKEIKKGVHARKKDLKDMKIACILNKIKDPA